MRSLFAPALLCALLTSQPGSGAVVTDYGYPFADPLVGDVGAVDVVGGSSFG